MSTNTIVRNKNALMALFGSLLLALLLGGGQAVADSLADLRASGAIGESVTGYAVARDPSAQSEVDAINAKRKSMYQEKATAQGVSIDEVGKVYAIEIIKKIPPGTWVQNEGGQWSKK